MNVSFLYIAGQCIQPHFVSVVNPKLLKVRSEKSMRSGVIRPMRQSHCEYGPAVDYEILGVRDANRVQAGHLKQCRFRSTGVLMRDRVLLRQFVCSQSREMGSPNWLATARPRVKTSIWLGLVCEKLRYNIDVVSLQHGILSRAEKHVCPGCR